LRFVFIENEKTYPLFHFSVGAHKTTTVMAPREADEEPVRVPPVCVALSAFVQFFENIPLLKIKIYSDSKVL
jgi:hypothetical protein